MHLLKPFFAFAIFGTSTFALPDVNDRRATPSQPDSNLANTLPKRGLTNCGGAWIYDDDKDLKKWHQEYRAALTVENKCQDLSPSLMSGTTEPMHCYKIDHDNCECRFYKSKDDCDHHKDKFMESSTAKVDRVQFKDQSKRFVECRSKPANW